VVAGSRQTLKRLDVQTGKEMRSFEGWKGALLAIALSPDGKLLAAGSGQGECALWDAQSGELKRTLRDLGGPVTGGGFSPDGKTLATGVAELAKGKGEKDQNDYQSGEVKLWSVAQLLE